MDRTPIEIGRTRRPMECELTIEERGQRSDQVHSELEVRTQEQAKQETLESEAKAKKEEGKAVEARIAQLDLRIKDLSQAARTGRETRPVDVAKLYDPTTGEIVERREDTGELIPLKRAPTAQEWDAIKEQQQLTIDEVIAPPVAAKEQPAPSAPTPLADPSAVRSPDQIPGLALHRYSAEARGTLFGLGVEAGEGYGPGLDSGEDVGAYLADALLPSGDLGAGPDPVRLTPAEQEQLLAGLRAGTAVHQDGVRPSLLGTTALAAARWLGDLHRSKGVALLPIGQAVADAIGYVGAPAHELADLLEAYTGAGASEEPPAAPKPKRGRAKKGGAA